MLHHEFPRIHRPTPTSREILRMLRYRHKLVKLRTIVKNSLQSLSIQAGLSLQARLFTRQGQQQLLTVPMTPVMRHQGQQWLELLQELNQRITETEGWLKQQALPDPRISLLRTHPGLGLLSSLGIVHTLIPVSRFPNTRKLAAYGGFDPMERSSADKKRYLGISKAGSRLLNGIEELVSHFPSNPLNEESIKSYNRAVEDCIDGVREFLTLHYCTSTRADTPFWKATKSDLVIPEALQERLKLWKVRLPNNRNIIPKYHGFESYSHSVMLIGLGYIPEHSLPVLNHISDEKAMATFQAIKDSAANLCRTLPSQYDCLTSIYNSHKLDGAQAETSRCAQY